MFQRKKKVGAYIDRLGTVIAVVRKGERYTAGLASNIPTAYRLAGWRFNETALDGFIVDPEGTYPVRFGEDGRVMWGGIESECLLPDAIWIPA